MSEIKVKPELTAVIGDIIRSRGARREATHAALIHALSILPAAITPLAPTVGDEIQGVFATVPEAIRSTHLLRLHMISHGSDIRFGIGVGQIVQISSQIQDGSAWWNAREALDGVEKLAEEPGWTGVRTGVVTEGATSDSQFTHLPATLHLIDAAISKLKADVAGSLLGLLTGESNQTTAERLGITASANTQRILSNDLRPLAAAMRVHWPAA